MVDGKSIAKHDPPVVSTHTDVHVRGHLPVTVGDLPGGTTTLKAGQYPNGITIFFDSFAQLASFSDNLAMLVDARRELLADEAAKLQEPDPSAPDEDDLPL